MSYGARPGAWGHWDLMLGLTADLLPVVSDPTATISPKSNMKQIGKTPSRFNANGEVAGFKGWTEKTTTGANIDAWKKDDRLGICLQTRYWRALDIDVPDQEAGQAIACRIAELLPDTELALRFRQGTGKCLIAFRMKGEFAKRVMKVEGGIIEFLANGQQFIVEGTHPDGTRYEWVGGFPDEPAEISEHNFERLWRVLVDELAIETPAEVRQHVARLKGETVETDDPVAQFLQEKWVCYGVDRNGAIMIDCPWKAGHESDNGPTETVWFPAGTGGYAQGHFKCMHESCRPQWPQFLDACGYNDTLFEDETAAVAELYAAAGKQMALPLPGFKRDKQGVIDNNLQNIAKALAHAEACGAQIRFDTFRAELMLSTDGANWRPFTDGDAVRLRIALEKIGFKPVSKEAMRDCLAKLQDEQTMDTARVWLDSLPPWDGVARIEHFYPRYFKTKDTPYTRACGVYAWTGHAGRILEPACKADMVPVLVGEQGLRKSSGVKAMAPSKTFFKEIGFHEKEDDMSRKLRGTLVLELAELKGLNSRDSETIKAWVARTDEAWTPKFKEYQTTFERRCLMHGTTNDREFLGDPTGERRWLPMVVEEVVDVDAIELDRVQLWAEGAAKFKAGGVAYEAAERLAKAEHGEFKTGDVWERPIANWLVAETDLVGGSPSQGDFLHMHEVLEEALGISRSSISRASEMRAGKILRAHGWEPGRVISEGRQIRAWVRRPLTTSEG